MPADRRPPIVYLVVAELPGRPGSDWKSYLEGPVSMWSTDDDFLPQLKEFLMDGDNGALLHKDEDLYLEILERDANNVLVRDYSGPEYLALGLVHPRIYDMNSMD